MGSYYKNPNYRKNDNKAKDETYYKELEEKEKREKRQRLKEAKKLRIKYKRKMDKEDNFLSEVKKQEIKDIYKSVESKYGYKKKKNPEAIDEKMRQQMLQRETRNLLKEGILPVENIGLLEDVIRELEQDENEQFKKIDIRRVIELLTEKNKETQTREGTIIDNYRKVMGYYNENRKKGTQVEKNTTKGKQRAFRDRINFKVKSTQSSKKIKKQSNNGKNYDERHNGR